MAHDRMMNDDLDRNMGGAGQEDIGKQDFGKETPGRNPQQGQETGQKGAGQKGQNKPSQAEGEDFDEFGGGGSNPSSGRPNR
ncbi:MAG TPA: hypothetical protein VFS77_16315 [Pyrinomonadaceae bacterium]|nr:hypothetical protein [Pyrinomonadaceae bacterium]